MKRLPIVLLVLALLAVPASARRHRRAARRSTSVRRTAPTPTIPSVRNVILMVANGYEGSDWNTLRGGLPGGLTAWDRMPATCVALWPDHYIPDAAGLARLLSTGRNGLAEPLPTTLPALAKQAGKSVAIVGDATITDPLPAFLAVPGNGEPNTEILRRLAQARFDAMFARSVSDDLSPELEAFGYKVIIDPQAILMAEATPLVATAPAEAVPFDTLAFRALHLVAKNPKGFVMVISASRSGAKPEEFNAAVSTARNYSGRDGRTLIVVALSAADGSITLCADGMYARKFVGTLMLTDVPQIVAGVAGIKGMARDFSPLYAPRITGFAPVRRKGIISLPW